MSLGEELAALRKKVKELYLYNIKVSKEQRMRFVAKKTDGGDRKGRISLYCRVLEISRQGF